MKECPVCGRESEGPYCGKVCKQSGEREARYKQTIESLDNMMKGKEGNCDPIIKKMREHEGRANKYADLYDIMFQRNQTLAKDLEECKKKSNETK